jgi:integrating conjugative element relaxase (TIGR03760 family)
MTIVSGLRIIDSNAQTGITWWNWTAISRKIIKFFQAGTVETVDSRLVQIQTANELLRKHKKLIDGIYHQSHVPEKHFKRLYFYSIERLAIWVQNLPASQNHHHSSSGGFLLHTLEVVEIAIKRRNTKMLPIGTNVEKQNEKKDLWTFAIFVAALLHDIGKTVSDVDIMLYDVKHKALGKWSPWFGRMSDVSDAKYYRYQYNASRKYQQHSLLPLTLLSQFINPVAIDWMQKESDLFTLLLMSLQGRHAEGAIIADIIKYADSESSARSLRNSNNSNSPKPDQPQLQTQLQPQPKSLADKLLDTLRYLVLETNLKINAPGAVMFTTANDIYFVSKVIMDKIRDSLNKDKQKGIPFDNSRMMDELLQFHIITPNQKGKAIWNCKLSGGGFKKPVKLTMLKMPLEKIYFKAGGNNDYDDDYNDVFSGDIIEQTDEVMSNKAKLSTSNIEPGTQTPEAKGDKHASIQKITPVESTLSLPLPPGFETSPINKEIGEDVIDATQKTQRTQRTQSPAQELKKPINASTSTSTSTSTSASTSTRQLGSNKLLLETELGKDFLEWLIKAINSKTIAINTAQSKVHIVTYKGDKALFLVSPKIFKEYDIDQWAKTQKQFGRLKSNLKTHTGENIWQVQTKTQRKGRTPSKIRGYLIIELNRHSFNLNNLPEANKYLDLMTSQPKNNE